MTRTKKCKIYKNIFSVLHFLLLFGPLSYYVIKAYIHGEPVEKVGISFTLIVSIILAVMSIVIDIKHRAGIHRSIMWLLIAGILLCLQEIKTFIWLMATTSIIDELIIVKAKEHYKVAYISNKEFDKRQ